MKQILVLGYGKMGSAIAHILRKKYSCVTADKFVQTANIISDDYQGMIQDVNPSIVVSALPYHQNIDVALACNARNIPYVDLGGKVKNTDYIKDLSRINPNIACFTDLGLAPGLINIYTQRLVEIHVEEYGKAPHKVVSMVGGIPTTATDEPFNYHCTWSIEGLWNEYMDECEVLENGQKQYKPGMSDLTDEFSVIINSRLEAFRTSGGSSHSIQWMYDHGIYNYQYKTLRYPGHRNFVNNLSVLTKNQDRQISIFKRLSDTAPTKVDQVVCMVRVDDTLNEFVVKGTQYLTAMQVATATPIAVVTDMILDGILPSRYLTYDDVVAQYDEFSNRLFDKSGIDL